MATNYAQDGWPGGKATMADGPHQGFEMLLPQGLSFLHIPNGDPQPGVPARTCIYGLQVDGTWTHQCAQGECPATGGQR